MANKNRRRRMKKKKEGAGNLPLIILAGVMLVGMVASGFLMGNSGGENDQGPVYTTPPPQTPAPPAVKMITLRHNPVVSGPISINDTVIIIDNNHKLAGKTLVFNITLLNITKGDGVEAYVEEGDNIEVDYVGSLGDGSVFDTSIGRVPLRFMVGAGQMITGFDAGVRNMTINETKTVTILPEDAYGLYDQARVQRVPMTQEIPKTMTVSFPVNFELTSDKYVEMFGKLPVAGDVVYVDELKWNATVLLMKGYNVSMKTLISLGDIYPFPGLPWNTTVMWVATSQLDLEHMAEANTTVQFPDMPWNTTVVSVGEENLYVVLP